MGISYKTWTNCTKNGPCSERKPSSELQPGPPFNHKTTGSISGFPCDSTNLNKTIHIKGNGNIVFYCPKYQNSWNCMTYFKVFSYRFLFSRYLTSKFGIVRHLRYSQLCIHDVTTGVSKFSSLELDVIVN